MTRTKSIKPVNENKLAISTLARNEGKETPTLGQTKETVDNLLDELAEFYTLSQVVALVEKHREQLGV